MTCETPTIRPLRRTDFPALEELIRLAWYDDGNDSHNTHDEVGQTSGPDKHRAELRKATRLRNMHRLAAIDMQDCLARTTKAYVAELNGQVLGVILGSLRSDITGRQRTRCADIASRCRCWQATRDVTVCLRSWPFCRPTRR